ncbi:MAG: tetratricopeptide repeat protein [Terracidiphilus sp.]|jgi:tetratricopeptide (TPR) repeat protein
MYSLLPGLLISFVLAASAAAAPANFETIASQADKARTQDRVPDAIRLYREGTHLRPSWADGWWYLGSLFYDQDRFPEAGAAFQHLLASTSHRGPAHAFLALCDYETGKYDDALAQFRAWAGAGWAGPRELRDVADYHFALLLTRDGRFVESLYLIAPLAQRLGDRSELVEAMGLASLRMRYLPENYPPERRERIWLAGKAALYAAQSPKDFERADEYAAGLESRYGTQPEVHYFRGTLYGFEEKNAEAEREYREELKISPDHVPSLDALAGLDLERSDLAEAGALARRAVAVDSNDAEGHRLLGRVFFAHGDLHAAVAELEKAKQLAPENPLVRSHLAMVYAKLGQTQEAKAEAAAFLALKNKDEVMASQQEKLGKNNGENVH